jgi:hypothetical protein
LQFSMVYENFPVIWLIILLLFIIIISGINKEKRGTHMYTKLPPENNNCLFDAVLHSSGLAQQGANSQGLRNECDKVLLSEGMPLIPRGTPAGEQYLQAISCVLNRGIRVYRDDWSGPIDIKHELVSPSAEVIHIKHIGNSLHGHWLPKF